MIDTYSITGWWAIGERCVTGYSWTWLDCEDIIQADTSSDWRMALLPPSQIWFDHPRGSPAWVVRAKEAKIGQMRGYVQVLHLVYVFSLFVLCSVILKALLVMHFLNEYSVIMCCQ